MARLTKDQTDQLRAILGKLEEVQTYLMGAGVAVARKGSPATTTLHYTREDGSTLYEVDKEIGTPLVFLADGIDRLSKFIVYQGHLKKVKH